MLTTIAGTAGALLAAAILLLMSLSSPLQEVEQARRRSRTSPVARPGRAGAPQAAAQQAAPRPTVPMATRPRRTGTTCVARTKTPHPVR
ncbi:hypothetical protein IQ251_09510 [Saccharopolyspora sp. HNM0983]|uniref:Uncharacterized protein n=1 Tax=Saccharopolyspora montiporae TaxID=2781240 RepID=A0A929BAS3_9PSEU|nr:hypothetical protein [Saccharopolyspora sp. HNM0983]MBE9374683.1 hypothetical protein [Saccharopolyspora sp. HNM0983]